MSFDYDALLGVSTPLSSELLMNGNKHAFSTSTNHVDKATFIATCVLNSALREESCFKSLGAVGSNLLGTPPS